MSKAEKIRLALSLGSTTADAARDAGVSEDYVRAVRSRAKKAPEPARQEPVPETEVQRLQASLDRANTRLRAAEKRLKDAEQAGLSCEEVRAKIFGLAEEPAAPPAWIGGAAQSINMDEETPISIWSDWHLGEVVDASAINGVNYFDLKTADWRINRLVTKILHLSFDHRTSSVTYPGIVVCLGGDIVSGEIHDELKQTNEVDLLPVVLWARDRIVTALSVLADRFGQVFCPCVAGNHGRTTRRIEGKHFVYKNFDWLIYTLCERYFADTGDDRVKFYIPASNEAQFRVYSHTFQLLHGHDLGVKGGDGIIGALGPIMRGKMKVGSQQAQLGRDFDTLLVGHWHQYISLRGLVVNGSLKGYDEFANAMLRAGFEPPTQAFWFQHPTVGMASSWPIRLDSPAAPQGSAWVSWRK